MEPVYSRSPLTLSSDALWEETPWSRTSPLTDETVTSLASMSSTRTSPLTLSISACLPHLALGPLRHLHAVAHGDVPVVVPMAAAPSGVLRRDPHPVSELGHFDVDTLQELRILLILHALDGVDQDRRARPALDVDVARDVADRKRGVGTHLQS